MKEALSQLQSSLEKVQRQEKGYLVIRTLQ